MKRLLILVITVAAFPIGAASQQTPAVSLVVTITDKTGRYVGGIKKDQVTVVDEDAAQEISSFEKANVPFSVAVLLDMQAAKRADFVKPAKAALLRSIAASNSANEYLIAGLDGNSYSATPVPLFARSRKGYYELPN